MHAGRRLLLPPYFFLMVFFVLPVTLILIMSLTRERSLWSGVTLSHYARILDPLYLGILMRSIMYALVATLFALLLGLPMAYYISFSSSRMKLMLMFLVLVPFWTNFLVRIFAWLTILGRQGLLNSLLVWSGLIQEPLQLLHTGGAVILGLVYGELPFMILPIVASMDRMNPALLEAATDLGASRSRVFQQIVLPIAMPGILAGIIFVFIPSLGSFVVPDILGGRDSFMLGNTIRNQFMTVRDWSFGSSLSMLLMLCVLLGISSYLRKGKHGATQLGDVL